LKAPLGIGILWMLFGYFYLLLFTGEATLSLGSRVNITILYAPVKHYALINTFDSFALLSLILLVIMTGLIAVVFISQSYLYAMLSLEIIYLGLVVAFVAYANFFHDSIAVVYALITVVVAASESAVGLGILFVIYRFDQSVEYTPYETLGG
jgi:NADH:ubiquinone oxidoreductase subunit K